MICSFCFERLFRGIYCYYEGFFRCGQYRSIYIDDIKSGNVVFILPFSVYENDKKDYDKIGEMFTNAVKDFFGEDFREDMIMQINEEERQEEIRYWEKLTRPIDNWDRKLKRDETN